VRLSERKKLTWVAATSSANTSADLMTEARESKSDCDVLRPVVQREWHSANGESTQKKTKCVFVFIYSWVNLDLGTGHGAIKQRAPSLASSKQQARDLSRAQSYMGQGVTR
jgi:hypothetical protein